jgi:hypothetical protein
MAETFLCFAYGSNMFSRRLKERTPSARATGIGFVNQHRLTFDKVSRDGSGKCDMEATINPADRVHGVLFRISKAEESALDAAEGLGAGYKKGEFEVMTSKGMCAAVAYFADKKNPRLLPYHWYKALVIAGAEEHGLPNDYVELLRKVKSQPDLDSKRRLESEAILAGHNT